MVSHMKVTVRVGNLVRGEHDRYSGQTQHSYAYL